MDSVQIGDHMPFNGLRLMNQSLRVLLQDRVFMETLDANIQIEPLGTKRDQTSTWKSNSRTDWAVWNGNQLFVVSDNRALYQDG
jgi:hypothetical protein